jgi:putative SOS response-associated peptidase YedK
MPVLLVDDATTRWMDDAAREPELRSLLSPYDRDDLEMFEVARYVNNAANDSPECIARIHADSIGSFLL